MRKIYSFLKGMSAVKSLFLSLLCLWTVTTVSANSVTIGATPYPSIQAAVTDAAPGATIIVGPGVYFEGNIEITKPLTILGPQVGISPNAANTRLTNESGEAVIDIAAFSSLAGYNPAFIVRQSSGASYGVTIKGFTFKNGSPVQDGHSDYDASFVRVDVTFENNIVKNGQVIYGGYYWRDIKVNDNYFNNPTVFSGADAGRADAVYILGGRNVDVTNNVINTSFVGILVKGQQKGNNPPITQINILKNKISTTTEEAIQIGELIVNATVSENEINGASLIGGIRIYSPTVTGRVDIINNIVKNTPAGVILTEGLASQNININYNSLDQSNTLSIVNNGTGPLKATCNWLGIAACPGVEGRVSGDVIYSPFLQNGVDNAPTTIGFQTNAPCTACCTLAATVATQTNVKCYGGNDGSVTFNITGAIGNYTVDNVTKGTTNVGNPATGLAAGSYSFLITDANGCKVTVPVTIMQPNAALVATASGQQNIDCTHPTGSVTINATGGVAPYTGTGLQSGLAAGKTTFTVTDANGCKGTVDVTITAASAIVVTASGQQNIDCTHPTGSVTINATGGVAPYTGTGLQSGLAAGKTTFTVTDANGCKGTVDVTITAASAIVVTASGQQNIDCTHPTGSVTINATGGVAPYTGTGLQSGLAAGKTTFTVTDANGCKGTVDVTITAASAIVVTASGQQNIDCTHPTGSVTINATGGVAPYTGTGLQSGLAAGKTTFTVTDANGCKGTVDVTITAASAIVVTASGQQNIDCTHPTGSVTINATGGVAPYTGTGLQSGLAAGKTTFTVTDANGCKGTVDVTITAASAIVVTASGQQNIDCTHPTGSVTINATGGVAPYTGTGLQSGLAAGKTTFTVTDANGCKGTVDVTITAASAIVVTASGQQNIDCTHPTGSVTINATGGVAPYTGTGLQSGLAAGKTTFTVTDANGCKGTVDVAITKTDCPPVCTLKASITTKVDVTCFGGSNGSVTITATGGTPSYTGTGTFSNLKAGNYSYKVKDSKGCEVYVSFYIDQPDELKVPYTQKNVTCKGASDGSVTFTISGGTAPYVIKNVTTGANNLSNPVTGLKAGTYSFLITDKNGCCKTVSVCITEPTTPCAPVCTLKATITDKDDVTCFGGNNGSVTITATGGTPSYTGTGTFSNLKAGNYSYKVKDSKGCEVYVSFYIDEPDELKVTSSITAASCKGASDGSVKFTITGGTSPYVIKNVTTGANNLSNPVTGLKAGTYSFLITDKNGCCKTVSVCITEPSTPCVLPCKVTVTTTPAPYCECNSKGSATITITGGKAPFKYMFNPGNITGTTNERTGTVELGAGNYSIKITDASGCESSASFTVKETDPITASIGVKLNTTFPGQKPKTIYVGYTTQYATLSAENVKGGTPPYTYKWYPSTGLATPNDDETKATPTCTTTYTLVITDKNGCRFYKCVTIKVVDLRCGAYNNKVEICCKGKTLCVDKNLVSGYLATGSTLGSCGCDDDDDDDHDGNDRNSGTSDEATAAISDDAQAAPELNVGGVYPNPTGGIFRVSLAPMNIPVQIVVGDANGKPISTVSRINSTTAGQTVDFNLSNQPVGMYLVRVIQGQVRKTYKVFIVR